MTRVRLTMTRPFLAAALAALEEAPGQVLRYEAGTRRCDGELELLLPGPAAPSESTVHVRLFRPPAALRRVSHRYWEAFDRRHHARATLDLALDGEHGGSAALLMRDLVLPVAEVRVVGPGLPSWIPGTRPVEQPDDVPVDGRHSRYAGALGGARVLARLQRLVAAFVEPGALEQRLALEFARAGLGVVLATGGACDEQREALRRVDCADDGHTSLERPMDHWMRGESCSRVRKAHGPGALGRAAAADLFVSAGSGPVRFGMASLASLYLRPQLDLRSVDGGSGPATEVRLLLPGEGRCLACLDSAGPRTSTSGGNQPVARRSALESFALGLALTLLERLATGDLPTSTRVRLHLGGDGRIQPEPLPWPPGATPCQACALAGWGDEGFRSTADSPSALAR